MTKSNEKLREELIEMACNAAWRRDYPNGGSLYKTYDGTPYYDKQLYRKEVAPIVDAFASAGKLINHTDKLLEMAVEALKTCKVFAGCELEYDQQLVEETLLTLQQHLGKE